MRADEGRPRNDATATLMHLPDGVLLTDDRQRICWSNTAVTRMTGWTADELSEMPLGLLIPGEQLEAIARARGIEPGQLQRYHCLLREKSGEHREVSVSVGRADISETPATMYVLRDLRRQRVLERRLLAELEENQALKGFARKATGVVHDLRHLNHLLGVTVKNLQRHRDEPAFVEEALRLLGTLGGRMRHVLGGLAVEPAHAGLRRQLTDVRDLVHHALALLGRPGRETPSEVALEGFDQPLLSDVDPDEILRVVFNVLVNALDAVAPEGHVTVRAASDAPTGRVTLVVEDDGPGLAAAYLRNDLFRPFRSTKPEGLGLGLYQAKSIVESHGGTLKVANREEGPGARVTIVLPGVVEPGRRTWLAAPEKESHATA